MRSMRSPSAMKKVATDGEQHERAQGVGIAGGEARTRQCRRAAGARRRRRDPRGRATAPAAPDPRWARRACRRSPSPGGDRGRSLDRARRERLRPARQSQAQRWRERSPPATQHEQDEADDASERRQCEPETGPGNREEEAEGDGEGGDQRPQPLPDQGVASARERDRKGRAAHRPKCAATVRSVRPRVPRRITSFRPLCSATSGPNRTLSCRRQGGD